MSGCERFERLIEEYLGGEISPEDLETLQQHSRSCLGCRMMMELHRGLSEGPVEVHQPTEGEYAGMRAAVLRRVRAGGGKRKMGSFWKRLVSLPAARPAFAPVFVVLLIALGFVLGRMWPKPARLDDHLLVEEITRQASLGRGLNGYWESPFTYSNVSMHQRNSSDLTLSFDVTRRIDVETTLDSPLAREVLVYAMIDHSNMGLRFEAMAVAERSMDEKLKEALVFVLLNDPSMPVRLKSLDILSRHASDPDVQDALLTSLSQDPSVQVRMMALQSLASLNVAPEAIRKAIEERPDRSDRAVLHLASQLIGDR